MKLRSQYDYEKPKFNALPIHKSFIGMAFWDAYSMVKNSRHDKQYWIKDLKRWFQGKLGEIIVWDMLNKVDGFICELPTHYLNSINEGDDGDITVIKTDTGKRYKFSVKTTMNNYRLLTEQVNHYNDDGVYKPGVKDIIFDRHYIVRVNYDISKLNVMKLIYTDPYKLCNELMALPWKYDIPGYMTHKDFLEVIKAKHIIPAGEMNHRSAVYFAHQVDLRPIKQNSF